MNQEGASECCAVCNVETSNRCARCISVYYCCRDHQRSDWRKHKSECLPKLINCAPSKATQVPPAPKSTEDSSRKQEETKTTHLPEHSGNDDRKKSITKSKQLVEKEGSAPKDSKQTAPTQVPGTKDCKRDASTTNKTANLVRPSTSKQNSVNIVSNSKNSAQGAITYEGSSENEILSESAQQLNIAGFSSSNSATNSLSSASKPADGKMAVMPGVMHQLPSGISNREYPEASLRSNPLLNNYRMDSTDPCYQICQQVIKDMNQYGVCVLNNFLGREKGMLVRQEVLDMYNSGIFMAGQLVSDPGGMGTQSIRSDRITWINGREPHCHNIASLINQVDSIILGANKMSNNGKMGDYIINTRSKAMVACYPGSGSNYVKHVDNPKHDGRCITAIYYLNLGWDVERSGGLLRIFPEGSDVVANIEPIFDRMLFFWSDRRNPHEVQPAYDTRYAITLWYFDAKEREEALRLYIPRHAAFDKQVMQALRSLSLDKTIALPTHM